MTTKRVATLSIEYFRSTFGTRLIFKSLEEVISSEEMSVRRMLFRVRNVYTGIDIAFEEFVIEVELKQSTAIFKTVFP